MDGRDEEKAYKLEKKRKIIVAKGEGVKTSWPAYQKNARKATIHFTEGKEKKGNAADTQPAENHVWSITFLNIYAYQNRKAREKLWGGQGKS